MNRPDQPNIDSDLLDEQLVAYLDGELPADAQRQLEQKLADDALSRERLRDLQQTWDLLDHLPSAQTDRSFTRTTVEMVATKASEDATAHQRAHAHWTRRRRVYGGVLALATLMAGFVVCRLLWTAHVDRQVRDLPVIENMDLYSNAEDIDFLRELDGRRLFASDDLNPESATAPQRLFVEVDEASVRRKASQLTPAEKTQLQRQKERFDAKSPEAQDRMRRLNASLSAAKDRDRLFLIMAQYHEWLKSLSPEQMYKLLALPPQERLTRIEQLEREQDADRFRRLAEQTSRDDFPAIVQWNKEFYARHEDAAAQRLSDDERAQWQEAKDQGKEGFGRRFMIVKPRLPKATDDEVQQLAKRLSPQARQLLLKSTGEQREELIDKWTRAAFWSGWRPRFSEDELRRFLQSDELEDEKRNELVNMRWEDARKELEHLYLRRRFARGGPGGPDRPGPWGMGPPPPPPRHFGEWDRPFGDGPRGDGPRDGRSGRDRPRRPPPGEPRGDRRDDWPGGPDMGYRPSEEPPDGWPRRRLPGRDRSDDNGSDKPSADVAPPAQPVAPSAPSQDAAAESIAPANPDP